MNCACHQLLAFCAMFLFDSSELAGLKDCLAMATCEVRSCRIFGVELVEKIELLKVRPVVGYEGYQ